MRLALVFTSLLFTIFAMGLAAAGTGDLDGDGKRTTTDLNLLRDYLLGITTLTGAQQTQADLNGDSQVHIADIIKMLNQKPVVGTFAINNGATTTLNLKVHLNNSCLYGPYEYIASESPSFSGASWQPYSTAPEFMLSPGNGAKTVWFKVRNVSGTSGAQSDTITLNEQPGGQTITLNLPGGVPLVLVKCPAGSFQMGRTPGEQDSRWYEDPQHTVTLANPFYLGKYEVTKRQWQAVMGTTPWFGQANVLNDLDSPAVWISWNNITNEGGFMGKLNQHLTSTGQVAIVRLPSEAEWEYACRAGTTTRFYWGDDPTYSQIVNYAWCSYNAFDIGERYAHVVGRKQPNVWGLYDMSGNVWELCQDYFVSSYNGTPTDGRAQIWPDDYTYERVLRGGSSGGVPPLEYLRSAARSSSEPYHNYSSIGFRVAAPRN